MLKNMIEEIRTTDIIPIYSGHEVCEKNHKHGPHIRDFYLVHFCLKGKGMLVDKFGSHTIRQGELFIIRPGEITTYLADGSDPWEYSWIAFVGDLSDTFNTVAECYILEAAARKECAIFNACNAVGHINACEAVAITEHTVSNLSYAVGECYLCKHLAVAERIHSKTFYTFRNFYLLKASAIVKCKISYFRYATWNVNAFKIAAISESPRSNTLHTFGNDDVNKSCTRIKHSFFNACNTVRQFNPFETGAMLESINPYL